MSPPFYLKAKDLVTGYTEPVIGPLSFRVDPGEIIGLWGANGCGKSTLLRAIAGTAKIISGKLEMSPHLTLSWLSQHPVRLKEMPFSGWEYLHFAQANQKPPPARLATWLDNRIDKLSGGQYQLLSIWAILGGTANLVLLDEPTNNLDPASESILADILNSSGNKRSVMLVSHEQAFLKQVCHRVIEVGL